MKKAVLNAWPSVTVSEGNGWHSRLTLELTGLPERIEFADLTCNTDTDRGAGLGQADCDAGERPPQGTLHDIDRQIPKHEQAEFETCPGVILQDTYRYRFILYGVDLVMAADDIVVADGLVRMVRIRSSRGRAQDKPVAIQANRYTGQVAQADTLVESNPQVSPQVHRYAFGIKRGQQGLTQGLTGTRCTSMCFWSTRWGNNSTRLLCTDQPVMLVRVNSPARLVSGNNPAKFRRASNPARFL